MDDWIGRISEWIDDGVMDGWTNEGRVLSR